MKAETAFNVFEALPEQEKQRLLRMLSVSDLKEEKIIIKKPIITDSEAREIILNKFKDFSRRWKIKHQYK